MNSTTTFASNPATPRSLGGLSLLRDIKRAPLEYFTQLANVGAPYHWLQLGPQRVLFLADPVGVRHVFQGDPKHYHKSKYYQHLAPILNEAMLTSEEGLWRSQRNAAAPAFASHCYAEYVADIEHATSAMLERFRVHEAQGKPVDIYQECLWLALDIVFRAFFHEDDDKVKDRVNNALGDILRLAERRVWNLVNLPIDLVVQIPRYRRSLSYLKELTEGLIAKRRANLKYPNDLLSRFVALYDSETPQTQQLLRNNILAIVIAGHETTASNLAWTFYELARHPLARRKAQKEVDEVLASEEASSAIPKRLTYVSCALAEALRLYPPVWTVSREAKEPDTIPLSESRAISIARGDTVMLCAFALHRCERFWTDPESFWPERFAETPDKGVYFPFGGGQRTCIGMQFAKVETALCLARALREFDFTLIPGQNVAPEPTITLRPDRPVYLRLKKRTTPQQQQRATEPTATTVRICPHRGAIGLPS